jgi:uncharacterized damage-inducible protein DinB
MAAQQQPEFWQRGPVEGIITLLQPVAHALLQAQAEIHTTLNELPEALLWQQPAGLASPAFHVQHMTGVLDRLFTYARGQQLTEQQLSALKLEGVKNDSVNTMQLLQALDAQIGKAILQLRETTETQLTEARGIGRKQIPTNVLGLLFHAAEHTMRHNGQLLVTVKILGVQQ